jgi:hypothetical protein
MKFFLLLLFVAVLVVGAVVVFGGENLDAATDSGAAVPSTGVDTVAPFIDTENLPALPDAAQVQEDVQTVVDGASEAVEGWSEAAQPITDALQEAGEDALELLP